VTAAYVSPNDALNAVRNAALRLVQLISPDGKRDETALAIYFADPSSDGKKKPGSQGDRRDSLGDPPEDPDYPEPKPKPVAVRILEDGFELRAKSADGVTFPIQCKV